MTLYLLLALAVLLGVVYFLARALKAARQRVRIAEGKAQDAEARAHAATTELAARERDRHALEEDLARLRAGSPQSRLDASLGVLRDLAAREAGRAPADSVADPAPATGGNRP